MDDDALSAAFDRIADADHADAPSIGALQQRNRRRHKRRTTLASVVVVAVLAVGASAIALTRPTSHQDVRVASPGGAATTTSPTGAIPDDRVFTVGTVPSSLAYRSCTTESNDERDPSVVSTVTCTYDDPAMPTTDGLRITRVVQGATTALTSAFTGDDAVQAVSLSGGADDPSAARLVSIAGHRVLELGATGYRLLVGPDLIDLGTTGLSLSDVTAVIGGLRSSIPDAVAKAALVALPRGSMAVVQGSRPTWVQPDPLTPSTATRFPGTTTGALLFAPRSARPVEVEVTTGADTAVILDELAAGGTGAGQEVEIRGKRAVVVDASSQVPTSLPGPRSGPQVFVARDASTLVRVIGEAGTDSDLRPIAGALL